MSVVQTLRAPALTERPGLADHPRPTAWERKQRRTRGWLASSKKTHAGAQHVPINAVAVRREKQPRRASMSVLEGADVEASQGHCVYRVLAVAGLLLPRLAPAAEHRCSAARARRCTAPKPLNSTKLTLPPKPETPGARTPRPAPCEAAEAEQRRRTEPGAVYPREPADEETEASAPARRGLPPGTPCGVARGPHSKTKSRRRRARRGEPERRPAVPGAGSGAEHPQPEENPEHPPAAAFLAAPQPREQPRRGARAAHPARGAAGQAGP